MEYNAGELATIYKQVHRINQTKLKQIKQMDDLINFNIVAPTHNGLYTPKIDPLFYNTENTSLAALDGFVKTFKESQVQAAIMKNTKELQTEPAYQPEEELSNHSSFHSEEQLKGLTDLLSEENARSEITSAPEDSGNYSNPVTPIGNVGTSKINFHSSTIKNINHFNNLSELKRLSHPKRSCSNNKNQLTIPSKIPFEGVSFCPQSDIHYYQVLNAKELLNKSKSNSIKQKKTNIIRYDKLQQMKEILSNLNQSAVTPVIKTEESKKELPFLFNVKRKTKPSLKQRIPNISNNSAIISKNPFYSENPYKFLPKRFQRNPRFALSFKGKEDSSDTYAIPNDASEPIMEDSENESKTCLKLPELKKEVPTALESHTYLMRKTSIQASFNTGGSPQVEESHETTINKKSNVRMINFSNAIDQNPQVQPHEHKVANSQHPFSNKKYYKRVVRVKPTNPELPPECPNQRDNNYSNKIKAIINKRQHAISHEVQPKTKNG
jgi:hypothetical protein